MAHPDSNISDKTGANKTLTRYLKLMRARPRFLSANSRWKWLFGIRNKLVLFMVAIVLLTIVGQQLLVSSTVNYSVRQKISDLLDESDVARTELNLTMQRGYSDVLRQILAKANAKDANLSCSLKAGTKLPVDKDFDGATVLGLYDKTKLENETFWYENKFSREWTADANPRWSIIYWKDSPPSQGTHQQADSGKNDRAFINLLVQVDDERHCLVELEITNLLHDKTRTARVVSFIVNVPTVFSGSQALSGAVGDLALSPSGSPLASNAIPNPNSDLTAIESPFAPMLRHIQDAVGQLNSQRQDDTSRKLGALHPATARTKQIGIPRKDLIPRIGEAGGTLFYSNAKVANAEAFSPKRLGKDTREEFDERLREFEEHVRDQLDPYAFIYPISEQFDEFRLRASSADSLALLKECVSHEVSILKSLPAAKSRLPANFNLTLSWQDIELENFVLAVQELSHQYARHDIPSADEAGEVSGIKGDDRQVIGYLVRAASIKEMEHSASEGVNWLVRMTIYGGILAIGLTYIVATYLTRPLTRMKTVAEKVSQIGFTPSLKDEAKIDQLLNSLPVGRLDEVGTLSEQFRKTTREVIDVNKRVRRQNSEMLAEQRKVEQKEREKAIADQVGHARMQLLASVSHDMRQPLHPIFYHAETMLQQPELDPEQRRVIGIILRNAYELNFLIEDILDYKRILAGDVVIDVDDVDLDQLMQDILDQHADAAESRGTKLVKNNMWRGTIKTDEMRLKRVLNNLISNACKATKNGEVIIQASPMGAEHVEISVTDNGIGMSELQQKLIFQTAERRAELERQYNVRVTRKDSNSTGLGLYICKQLVLAMGGEIRFFSEQGKGTRFVVKLPVNPPSTVKKNPTVAQAVTQRKLPAKAVHAESRPRAVVVDDDPRSTAILADLLTGLGYKVEELHDGESALERIAESIPQLVTLDVIMPGLDGWETLQRLKGNPATANVPVIMVTVHPDEEKASLLGASGFVSKPVDGQEFSSAVRQAIGNRSGARVLVVDDDAECRNQLIEMLEPLQCEILEAVDGEDALQRVAELKLEELDLAIVDLYMPNMDGFTLIEKLGLRPETRRTPIIVLSAGLLSESERSALLPRVAQFFSKGSVDIGTLRQEIERLLTQHAVDQQQTDLESTRLHSSGTV